MEVGLPACHNHLSIMTAASQAKDIAIIGGGVAGLSLAIQCARAGFDVVVFEKGDYPRHKVCGEYISHESTGFLNELGIPIESMDLPQIDTFRLTSHHEVEAECALEPGGFGLSRYTLDRLLAEEAKRAGAELRTNSRVTDVSGTASDGFDVTCAQGESEHFRLAIGAWGRQSGLAEKRAKNGRQAWVGIKYHVDAGPKDNEIEIHAFPAGYAGISKVEDGKYCLAYLCRSEALKSVGNDIPRLESEMLSVNPYLAKRLTSNKLEGPVTTSQFEFGVTPRHALPTIGDAAGFIPPLSGNGMSLALRGSKFLFEHISDYLHGRSDERVFEKHISHYAQTYLNRRIAQGRFLQHLLTMKPDWLNASMLAAFSKMPFALKTMTTLAVGKTI